MLENDEPLGNDLDSMKITGFIWLEDIVDKLDWKHRVQPYEVEEVFERDSLFRFVEKGHRQEENVYAALGQTFSGRYLIVFFIYKQKCIMINNRVFRDFCGSASAAASRSQNHVIQ